MIGGHADGRLGARRAARGAGAGRALCQGVLPAAHPCVEAQAGAFGELEQLLLDAAWVGVPDLKAEPVRLLEQLGGSHGVARGPFCACQPRLAGQQGFLTGTPVRSGAP